MNKTFKNLNQLPRGKPKGKFLVDIIDKDFPNCPPEKLDEVHAVKKFLDNEKIKFQFTEKNIETQPDEPADILVKDINKKFQVVVGDFQRSESSGKAKPDEKGFKRVEMFMEKEDVLREYIVRPLQKKSKYGKSANGITLLIKCAFYPSWIVELLDEWKKSVINQEFLDKLGFDEIYLVFPNKNLKI